MDSWYSKYYSANYGYNYFAIEDEGYTGDWSSSDAWTQSWATFARNNQDYIIAGPTNLNPYCGYDGEIEVVYNEMAGEIYGAPDSLGSEGNAYNRFGMGTWPDESVAFTDCESHTYVQNGDWSGSDCLRDC